MAALALTGTTAAASAPAAFPAGRVPPVPWREAGPGWTVVEYSTASLPGSTNPAPGPTTFYLVSPQGRKYPFYVTPTATAYPQLTLVDWSGDRQRILVARNTISDQRIVVEQISLATGAVVSTFRLPSDLLPDEYTRPSGQSILADGYGSRSLGIYRFGLTGHLQRILARGTSVLAPLDSPGGTYVVAGTRTGLDQVSNAGAITRRIRVPAAVHGCQPVRWWTASTVLAACSGRKSYGTQRLWLFSFGGCSPTALTPALRRHGLFIGYFNAWLLDGRLYLQADNAHDTLSIVRQFRDGARRTVTVPGPAGRSDFIVTAWAGRLLLWSGLGTGGPSSLFWFNPATRAIRFILRTPSDTSGVAGAIAYGYRNH